MTDLATTLGTQPRNDAQSGTISAQPARTPPFNTGQHVLGSSAAASTRLKTRLQRLLAAIRTLFVRAEKPSRPKHYPERHYFLEDAAMSREMHRL